MKALGQRKGWTRLTRALWPATEEDGWQMTAIAAKVLGAAGVYRSPDDDGFLFMVITSIRWSETRPDNL